ncbi:MAG: glycosyltransferase family 2 protein [Terriglobales bacterium]
MQPLVSTLIPAYNAERWIADTLKSVVGQTWPNKEIIVVDDGSKDGTVALARRFESAGVRVAEQENRGPAAARNHAYRLSQGDYIQFIDADDLLSPEKITEQIKVLGESPPRMLGICPWTYFQDGTDPEQGLAENGWPAVDTDAPVEWLTDLLGPEGPFGMVPHGAWLTPRAVAEDAGAWDETPSPDDDGEYFARVVLASAGIRRAAGRFYYRKRPTGGSWSSTRNATLLAGALYSLERKMQYLLARTNDPRARRALANRFVEHAVEAYPYFPEITRRALEKVQELGGTDFVPRFGSWKGELFRRVFGWKATKRAQAIYHRYKPRAETAAAAK